jgi:hypothetical protein
VGLFAAVGRVCRVQLRLIAAVKSRIAIKKDKVFIVVLNCNIMLV